jgi:hypothetical protein
VVAGRRFRKAHQMIVHVCVGDISATGRSGGTGLPFGFRPWLSGGGRRLKVPKRLDRRQPRMSDCAPYRSEFGA